MTSGWVSPRSICRPASFAPPNFAVLTPSAARWRRCRRCVRGSCCSPLPFRCSSASRSRPRNGASAPTPAACAPTWRLEWAETPLDDWIFAPDYADPAAGKPLRSAFAGRLRAVGPTGAAACAAGAILHYVRSTQRGTLDHIDRIGFYERQSCLVLDAVTVRNLELVEPLFSGASDTLRCSAPIDKTVTPMGKRLLRAWMLRPSIDAAEINLVSMPWKPPPATPSPARSCAARSTAFSMWSAAQPRHARTANPRRCACPGCFAGLPSCAGVRACAVWPRRLAAQTPAGTLHTAVDEMTDLRERIESDHRSRASHSVERWRRDCSRSGSTLDELRDLNRNSKQYVAQIEDRERRRTGINSPQGAVQLRLWLLS